MFSQWGRWGKTSVQTFSNRFLKTLTEGAVTTKAGSLFQYFTTLTENANPLLRRWLAPCSTLKGCPLRKEKQIRINIQKALEYLEGGNQVSPKLSPLQGTKAQSLQSLFIGELGFRSFEKVINNDLKAAILGYGLCVLNRIGSCSPRKLEL